MSPTRYRQLLILYFTIFLLAIASAFLPGGYSSGLADAYAAEPETWLMRGTWMPLVVVTVLVILWLLALAGLFRFKRSGRSLAVYLTILSLLAYPFIGTDLSSGLESALHEAHATLWGAILAISYSSPLSRRFESGDSFKPNP